MRAFKKLSNELRKDTIANVALHLVLTQKSEVNLHHFTTYSPSLHRRIISSNVVLNCVRSNGITDAGQ